MNDLISLEEKIFIFIINTISFLRTLKKRSITNEKTHEIASLIKVLNDIYAKSIEIKDYNERIKSWRLGLEALKRLHTLFMDLHFVDYELINEKADLQIETSLLKDNLTNIIYKLDKQ